LKVLDMGIRIKLKEKAFCIFSTVSVDVVSEYYSMTLDFALKPVGNGFLRIRTFICSKEYRVKTIVKLCVINVEMERERFLLF